MSESKLPEIIIIFLVAAFLLLVVLVKVGNVSEGTQKYIDTISNYFFGGQTSSTADIPKEFQKIVSQYKNCFDSKDDNCVCDIQILTFSPGYVLSFITPNNMMISKEETNIPNNKGSFAGKNIFCYVTYEDGKINTLDISTGIKDLSDKNVYIPLSASPLQLNYIRLSYSLTSEAKKVITGSTQETEVVTLNFLGPNQIAYKQGNNICFMLKDKLSEEGQAFANGLPKCHQNL